MVVLLTHKYFLHNISKAVSFSLYFISSYWWVSESKEYIKIIVGRLFCSRHLWWFSFCSYVLLYATSKIKIKNIIMFWNLIFLTFSQSLVSLLATRTTQQKKKNIRMHTLTATATTTTTENAFCFVRFVVPIVSFFLYALMLFLFFYFYSSPLHKTLLFFSFFLSCIFMQVFVD